MFCEKCGARLEKGSQFCNSCGNSILEKAGKVSKSDVSHNFDRSRANTFFAKHRRLFFIGVPLVFLLGVFFVAYLYFSHGSNNPVQVSAGQLTTPNQVASTSTTLSINSINPSTIVAPYQNIISISGSGFQSSTVVEAGSVELAISGDVEPSLLYVKYPGNFTPGTYNITAQNLDGTKTVLSNALDVLGATVPTSNQTPSPELSAAQIVSDVSPSVVLIRTDLGCGSGMIINTNGTILTDNHVISGAEYVSVYLNNGAVYTASVLDQNTTDDLALIKINDTGLPTVTFGDSSASSLPLGSPVTALGYPLTCNEDQTLEVDPGIVTARRTSSDLRSDVIQTSARINPGDSGGPLVDNYGHVIGINESILTVEDLDLNVTGIAFATPSDVLTYFINNPSYSNPSNISPGATNQPTPTTESPTPTYVTPSNSEEGVNVSVVIDNSQGGSASPSDFKLTVIGSDPSISSFFGSAAGTEVLLDAGTTFGINISQLPNYTALNNGDCNESGGLPGGGTTNCIFREEYINSSSQN